MNERSWVTSNHQVARRLLASPLHDEWLGSTLERLFIFGCLQRIFTGLNLLRTDLSAPQKSRRRRRTSRASEFIARQRVIVAELVPLLHNLRKFHARREPLEALEGSMTLVKTHSRVSILGPQIDINARQRNGATHDGNRLRARVLALSRDGVHRRRQHDGVLDDGGHEGNLLRQSSPFSKRVSHVFDNLLITRTETISRRRLSKVSEIQVRRLHAVFTIHQTTMVIRKHEVVKFTLLVTSGVHEEVHFATILRATNALVQ